ncbi:MAG: orotidine-5'-phosphate decarboxylase [Candidatus Hydromicrobium americanum]|nr:MAG: orotidine-5'-phosphate decarboxylase [Candidatus Hydromicrobium americanum]
MKDKKLSIKDRLIISVDQSKKIDVISLCKKISGRVSTLKLGLELIYGVGLEVIDTVKSFGYKVMLDAKLFDIPNTVKGAAEAIGGLGVSAVTIHTLGGRQMLEQTREILEKQSESRAKFRPLLFGVTILTSLDDKDLKTLGFKEDFSRSVLGLAGVAIEAGIDGIICSPDEVEAVRKKFGTNFYIATPGIRLPEDAAGDQKRINTPEEAMSRGADFIIVGRSITTREDVGGTIDLYLEKIERTLGHA